MFQKWLDTWYDHGFEILVGISIVVILLLALFRRGEKGTWTRIYRTQQQAPVPEPSSPKRSPESKGEIECRRVLRALFGKPFLKARPDTLRNPVTEGENNLELDCYDNELKLAVEYNGAQHYKYIPYFHRTRDAFNNQKYRDHIKRDLCVKNGIHLIEVPYTVKTEDIEFFLTEKLQKAGFL
jgi:hypothetical protein